LVAQAPGNIKLKEETKMNRIEKILIVLALVFCLVPFGSSVFAQGSARQWAQRFPEGTVGAMYQPSGWDTFEASWLIGYQVTTPREGYLGQISSLVIDNRNGRIALVVLSRVPNLAGEELAIPFSSLTRTGENTFEFKPGRMEIGVPGPFSTDPYVDAITRASGDSELYGIPSKIDPDWVSYIYRHYGQEPYWTEKGEHPMKAFDLYENTRLMGAEVRTTKGEEVGNVNDLVVDSSDGHIAFVVLSDIVGRGDTLVAVPFGALSRTGENVFVLNTTRKQLASAPSFNGHADLSNLSYAENVYRYFGLQPYWTEGGGAGGPTMGQPMGK
jgi:sporulation protein YlmC with PRC-barrel domain